MRASTPGPVERHEAQVVLALELGERPHRAAVAAPRCGTPQGGTRTAVPTARSRAAAIRSATTAVAVGIAPAPCP